VEEIVVGKNMWFKQDDQSSEKKEGNSEDQTPKDSHHILTEQTKNLRRLWEGLFFSK
jgi:hypothetical protein